jgi:hypothetical protein
MNTPIQKAVIDFLNDTKRRVSWNGDPFTPVNLFRKGSRLGGVTQQHDVIAFFSTPKEFSTMTLPEFCQTFGIKVPEDPVNVSQVEPSCATPRSLEPNASSWPGAKPLPLEHAV